MSELLGWLSGGCCAAGGTLTWGTPAPAMAAGATLLALGWLLSLRPISIERRAEYLLSLLGTGLLGLALARPVWLEASEHTEPGRFVILVDGSRSMSVRDGAGTAARPRSDAVADLLARLGADRAEVHTFADALTSGLPTGFDGDDTDLGGALAELEQRHAGERLEGIAVLTDGLDRGGLRRRMAAGGAASLPRLGGPLTLYQVGEAGQRVDAAITSLHGPDFGFLRSDTELQVDVRVVGSHLAELPVTLTRDGQPAGTRTARLDEEGRGTVSFSVRSTEVGRYVYEASVPVIDGDAVPANNTAHLVSRVVRERVRVLQVCGAPSWDQKFLRLFLKEDPGIDLVSFFILRTERDLGSGYRPDELALIQFPYLQLFTEELSSFDLVIFQNFDYAPYFERDSTELLQNLADYVRGGKALVMIGGDRSFDLGKYGGTPLAEVLPVKLGVGGDPTDPTPLRPSLTSAGARHPITQLVSDPAENAHLWAQLSQLDGVNLSAGAAPGAAVLLAHPTRQGPDGEPLPVLAVGEYGKGRSMALMGDSSWRWYLGEASEGRGNQAYLRFWKNAMRWLVGDPEDRPVSVTTDHENYGPGDEVRIAVEARDVGFAAVNGASVRVEVVGPGQHEELSGVTEAGGGVSFALRPEARGASRVRAKATGPDGTVLGEAETVFAVSARDPELEEVEPDAAFLQGLADAVGGRYVAPGAWQEPLRDASAARTVEERRETPLYSAPGLLGSIALLFSGSWWARRRAGLR